MTGEFCIGVRCKQMGGRLWRLFGQIVARSCGLACLVVLSLSSKRPCNQLVTFLSRAKTKAGWAGLAGHPDQPENLRRQFFGRETSTLGRCGWTIGQWQSLIVAIASSMHLDHDHDLEAATACVRAEYSVDSKRRTLG